jgi:hypothetical protein
VYFFINKTTNIINNPEIYLTADNPPILSGAAGILIKSEAVSLGLDNRIMNE